MSDQLKTDIHPLPSFKTFEATSVRIGNNSFSGFVCLYRFQNGTCQFFDLHLDKANGQTNKFNEILTCFDLKQHVNFPTHVHGHWLYLLITERTFNSNKSVFSAAGISDHLAVISEIDSCKTILNNKKI